MTNHGRVGARWRQIRPVYGSGEIGFVPKFGGVVGPSAIASGLDIDLVVAPERLGPRKADQSLEDSFGIAFEGAVDSQVVVKVLSVSAFKDGDDGYLSPMSVGEVTQRFPV